MIEDLDAPRFTAAVIGCGRLGELHAAALAESRDAMLSAVCDPDSARCRRLTERYRVASFADFREMLRAVRPDVVTVATPDALHFEPVIAALEAGSHVFCEKPLATQIDQARVMAATADKARRSLGVDFNRRYGFGYRRASELIRAGMIGAPQTAILHVTDAFPPASARTSPTAMLTTLLTHHFDLFRWLVGEPQSVQVVGTLDQTTNLLSRAALSFRFRSGAVGTILATYREKQTRTQEAMTLVGSLGSLIIDDVTQGVALVGSDPAQIQTWRGDVGDQQTAFWGTIGVHLRAFVAALRRGETPEVTAREGIASLRIAKAAERSWNTGQPVEIDDES